MRITFEVAINGIGEVMGVSFLCDRLPGAGLPYCFPRLPASTGLLMHEALSFALDGLPGAVCPCRMEEGTRFLPYRQNQFLN